MKVYVVTRGSYSDYRIDKVFLDKAKAEEYYEWLYHWDDKGLEEYDTDDDLFVNKYYSIQIVYDKYDYGDFMPDVKVYKTTDGLASGTFYEERSDNRGNYRRISMSRCVPATNYERNPDFYINKYKKAAYDYAAIAKQKRLEGATENDVRDLLRVIHKEDNMDEEV